MIYFQLGNVVCLSHLEILLKVFNVNLFYFEISLTRAWVGGADAIFIKETGVNLYVLSAWDGQAGQ